MFRLLKRSTCERDAISTPGLLSHALRKIRKLKPPYSMPSVTEWPHPASGSLALAGPFTEMLRSGRFGTPAQLMKTLPGAGFLGPLAWTAATARVLQWNRLAADRKRLKDVQLATLRANCRIAALTEFGQEHRLGDVAKLEDFRERVPLRPYAEFEPYLDRMRQGERNVLWPGLIQYFAQSSGSSNTLAQHKFLPISEQQIRWQQRAGFDVVARYVTQVGNAAFLGGFSLGLFPPSTLKTQGEVHGTNNPWI